MRRLIIDTDTASDDAVAIMMALNASHISVDALTIVAGNVNLQQASINARFTLELCGHSVPVYEGCDRPWLRAASTAEWFHGNDGMGNMHYPAPLSEPAINHAVTELIERFRREPGQIELVTLGPLTNIATALSMEPALAGWIKHCYVMGGAAATLGNVTPAAEYNFWCDPEAASKVLHSGIPMTLLGWELSCGNAALDNAEMEKISSSGTERARIAIECNRSAVEASRNLQAQSGMALADPVAMAVAIDPTIGTDIRHCYVDIETTSERTRGMSIVDLNNVQQRKKNANVCLKIDVTRWKKLLCDSLT
ncbi:nucleoside hydrolase [Granulosicoccus sp.]|nr:nucleoside hydrolase [Granulosicoccus sp.]MDB4223023.1 nucleoside hydrolase [Granulosicoccus sp.]